MLVRGNDDRFWQLLGVEFIQHCEDQWQQWHRFAIDLNIELNLKPVIVASLDFRIPGIHLLKIQQETRIDIDPPALALQLRRLLVDEFPPAIDAFHH